MFEVEVENFQSIEKASIRVEGYTALVGRSNIGKSALIRAIKCALTGATGTEFVRHGSKCERRARGTKKCACFSSVSIRLSPSLAVLWQKGDKVNRYEITRDGKTQEYEALERGDQEFLQPEFRRIMVGDSKDLIQVSDQFEPLFLVRDRGSVVADVLSDVAQLDDINGAIRLVSKDRKDAVSTRTVRERDANDLRQNLASYEGLDALEVRSAKLDATFRSIEEQERRVEKLSAMATRYDALQEDIAKLQIALRPSLPDWEAVMKKATALDQMVAFHGRLLALKETLTGLTAVTKPKLPDWDKIRVKNDALVQLCRFEEEWQEKNPIVTQLSGVGEVNVPDASTLPDKVQKLGQLDDWLRRMRAIKTLFEGLQGVKKLPELSGEPLSSKAQTLQLLEGMLSKHEKLLAAQKELEKRVTTAQVEEVAAIEELTALGVCPTCSQDIGAGHLHLVAS